MFNKLLKGLLASGASSVTTAKPSIFSFLDQMQYGLARRADTYLETGEDEQVLAELDALNVLTLRLEREQSNALANYPQNLRGKPGHIARYVRLRRAINWNVPNVRNSSSAHVEDTPELVRLLYRMVRPSFRKDIENATEIDDILAAVPLLGGSDLDIAVSSLPTQSYRYITAPTSFWERLEPSIFIEALERCDTKNRTAVIEAHKAFVTMKSKEAHAYLFTQLEATSAGLRKAARQALELQPAPEVEPKAIELLEAGKAATRTEAVQLLGKLGTPTALEALKARRETEKAQGIQTAIDAFINSSAAAAELGDVTDGYVDVTGAFVAIPTHEPLVDDGRSLPDDSIYKRLKKVEAAIHEESDLNFKRRLQYWENSKRSRPEDKPTPAPHNDIAKPWFNALNTPWKPGDDLPHVGYRYNAEFHALVEPALSEIPLYRVIKRAVGQTRRVDNVLGRHMPGFGAHVQSELENGSVHLSQVLAVIDEPSDGDEEHTAAKRYLNGMLAGGSRRVFPGVWEVAAPHLNKLIEALPPQQTDVYANLRALRVVADFPTLPQVLLPAVLFCAIDARPLLNKPAQDLLLDVDGIDDELIALLKDKRQAIRANAARFLADRGATSAVPALVKRMKTEKSELAKADMISAISRLGGDTGPYLSKDALLKEAEALTKKLPNEKIEWLDLNSAPVLQWADGTMANPVLADAWLRLALKLKSPLGSPLFGLYLDQMTPESAAAFADWVLDAWMSYDVAKPSTDELRTKATAQAQGIAASQSHWARNRPVEDIVRMLLAHMSKEYLNSGAESKGILALTHRATPSHAGPRIAAHLKKHGKRVNQAKALVEVLYAMGSRDAIQVLVATATRFRQKTVRALAETLVRDLAEARGWTEDELADRSIPSGGFEEDGTLPLPVGEEEKPYVARLDSALSVRLFNPAGKEVKSIPAGKDENTKESKALLNAAKKSVKAAVEQQTSRLYEAMLTPRTWDKEAWLDDFAAHPIMRRLIERLIWRGLDADGAARLTFRMTAEGDVMNADGDDADLADVILVDMAHTANVDEATRDAWLQHLKDFEVAPLFPQVSRPVHALTDDLLNSTKLEDRQGWLMSNFKLRSAAKKCGYERGIIGDGGGYDSYRKAFRGAGLHADLHFTGSYMGADDFDTAIDCMQFTRIDQGNSYHPQPVALKLVPPLLLSEVWNDLHEISKSGAYDPDWKKKGLY